MKNNKQKIGMVGLGWIGKNYANDFERRGYEVVRYSLEPKYKKNKLKLKECKIIFVAVPTPSTPEKGFDDSILISAIKTATSKGQTVVIKSTVKVGTTEKIQQMFPDRYIIHSPEFLTEKTAAYDVSNPDRNLVGYSSKSFSKCGEIMNMLPPAPYEKITTCNETELVKYMGNCWFYAKVMMMNLFYDVAKFHKLNFESVKEMLSADKRVGKTHLDVVHQGGRGAGGDCFIKDMVAFREMYNDYYLSNVDLMLNHEYPGLKFLETMEALNIELLSETGKSLKLLKKVYGRDNVITKLKI